MIVMWGLGLGSSFKYAVLPNSNAISTKDSLLKLVKFAEHYGKFGALNIVLLKYNSSLIDSVGDRLSRRITDPLSHES